MLRWVKRSSWNNTLFVLVVVLMSVGVCACVRAIKTICEGLFMFKTLCLFFVPLLFSNDEARFLSFIKK